MYMIDDSYGMHRSSQPACGTQEEQRDYLDLVSSPPLTPPDANDDVEVLSECQEKTGETRSDSQGALGITSQASLQELEAFVARSALLRACELPDFFSTALWLFTDEYGDVTTVQQHRVRAALSSAATRSNEADVWDGHSGTASRTSPSSCRADVLLREVIEAAYVTEDAIGAAQRAVVERALCGSSMRTCMREGEGTRVSPRDHGADAMSLTRQLQCAAYTGRFAQLRQEQLAALRQGWQRVDLIRATERHDECGLLVGDLVRYARLVLAWKAAYMACSGTSQTHCAVQEAKVTMPTGAAVTFADAGALLYGRYPPPLLRCGSLAQETCRLLKWLRTWRREASGSPASRTRETGTQQPPKRGSTRTRQKGKRARPARNAVTSSTRLTKRPRNEQCTTATGKSRRRKAMSGEDNTHSLPQQQQEQQQTAAGWATRMYGALWAQAVSEGVADGMPKTSLPSSPSLMPDIVHPPCSPTGASSSSLTHPLPAATSTTGRPRRGSALPFSDELAKEEGLLGSTTEVYYDSYGNRLRSARQARQDVNRLARAARRRRRREQQRGYFTHAAPDGPSAVPWWTRGTKDIGDFGPTRHVGLSRSASSSASSKGSRSSSSSSSTTTSDSSSSSSSSDSSDSESSSTSSSSSEDETEATGSFTNIAVVYGRTGVGKTAAVYVAAQLLGFRVVEMNSAVQRGAASVERLLAELTRSHRLGQLGPHTLGGQDVEQELQRLKKEQPGQQRRISTEMTTTAVTISPSTSPASGGGGTGAARKRERRKANAISVAAVSAFFAPRGVNNRNTSDGVNGDTCCAKGSQAERRGEVKGGEEDVVVVAVRDGRVTCENTPSVTPAHPTPISPSTPAPSSSSLPPSPSPTLATRNPTSNTTAGTVLLFEDADLVLGEESVRGFYAAVRELAQTSNIPIVVTVSAPPASPRYSYAFDGFVRSTAHKGAVVSDRMSALWAAAERLDGDLAASAATMNCTAHDVHRGEVATRSAGHEGATSVLPSNNNHHESRSVVHIPFNASVATQYFGPHTAFTTVQPTSHAALLGQLMVIAMVELGLCSLAQSDASLPRREDAPGTTALSCGVSYSDETASLVVHDVAGFRATAHTLCTALFAQHPTQPSMSSLQASCNKVTAASAVPRLRTTTDVRFWLNQLQYYLLRPASSADERPGGEETARHGTQHSTRTQALLSLCNTSLSRHNDASNANEADDDEEDEVGDSEEAVRASMWDCYRGRFAACLAYNDRHCVRQQRFDHAHLLNYASDVLDEVVYGRTRLPQCAAPALEAIVDVDNDDDNGAADVVRESCEAPLSTVEEKDKASVLSKRPRNEVIVEDSSDGAEVVSPASRPPLPTSTLCATPLVSAPRSHSGHSLAGQMALHLTRPRGRSPSVHTFSPEREPEAAAGGVHGSVDREEGAFTCTATALRPVELLLPYSPAQAFLFPAERDYSLGEYKGKEPAWVLSPPLLSSSSSSSAAAAVSSHTGGLGSMAGNKNSESGGEKDTVVGRRMRIVRALWSRPRKAECVRVLCAGRTSAAFEDVMGFTLLFTAAINSSTS